MSLIILSPAEVCNNPPIKETMHRFVLHMGAFHTSMTSIAVIGCHYGSAGLHDVLVEADVLAEGTDAQVLNGHQYNWAVRALKLMYKAMWHLSWADFMRWQENEMISETTDINSLVALVSALCIAPSSMSVCAIVSSKEFVKLKEDNSTKMDRIHWHG